MHVSEWMKESLHTISPGENLLHAWRVMLIHRIRHLPVVDGEGQLVGILSDRDIKQHALPSQSGQTILARQEHLEALGVEAVMVRRVITAGPTMTMERAARLMLADQIDSLPVVDGGTLIGLLTISDFLSYVIRADIEAA